MKTSEQTDAYSGSHWRRVTPALFEAVKTYLKKDEWQHVALTSRLGERGGKLWATADAGGQITGAVYFSPYGVLLPAYTPPPEKKFFRQFLQRRKNKLYTIIGMEERVIHLELLIKAAPSDAQNYRLLTAAGPLEPSGFSPGTALKLPGRLTVSRARPEDTDLLWPLQRAYLKEEVFRQNRRFSEEQGRKLFRLNLQNQIVYYASLDGRPAAKASTNARGMQWDQIGGVYTVPELRGRGLGTHVAARLLQAVQSEKKQACLFVKPDNTPALSLYRKMGFQDRGGFRISYWK